MKKQKRKTIFVGVSGGVDSSVSAALLRDQGHDVVGVFIRTWHPDWLGEKCTWRDERRDAMRVCAHLGIPFKELDLEDVYKTGVADYMISEYQAGRTPNPDVMCNREVKFGAFLDWARAHGADAVATGHYARNIFNKKTDLYELHTGTDEAKDQSYFLWTLSQEQLSQIIFPVGAMKKDRVRRLALTYDLPTARKKDSQGICFLGQIDMKDFLRHYINEQEGAVLDTDGSIIGTHRGALFFTLGERHGFTITKKNTSEKPYYVIAKDIKKNTITVSPKREFSDLSGSIIIQDCVWNTPPKEGVSYEATWRYHGEKKEAFIHMKDGKEIEVHITDLKEPIASGQSLVLYQGTQCFGGGVVL